MVRLLCLTTRCVSTMAARVPLRGLLHGRRHTSTPLLLPSRPPKCLTCPWTALTLPSHRPRQRPHTYSDILRTPLPLITQRHPHSRINCIPKPVPPFPPSHRSLFSNKCPRRGTLRWDLLAHRLTLLLSSILHHPPPAIILPQPVPIKHLASYLLFNTTSPTHRYHHYP